ncbi:hypothetical protein AP3564_05910 [Aeribacillus pallidus]|uniref:Uncharacterized protein n=1 Tax=Aeribacillus pallidus TaxID=33936 RepID=A0A223E3L2_9BACI|nr:hypothetical protein AP3564_05910 [Aeribacillus pallidus]
MIGFFISKRKSSGFIGSAAYFLQGRMKQNGFYFLCEILLVRTIWATSMHCGYVMKTFKKQKIAVFKMFISI